MRGMRGVGLVLVDKRGRGVDRAAIIEALVDTHGSGIVAEETIGAGRQRRAGQHHEVGCARLCAEQRIVRLKRDEDRPVAAFVHQVETMIEELAEEGEP